jgi:hypothetical protein
MLDSAVTLRLNPEMSVQKYSIGEERAPLLVFDNVVENPQELVAAATRSNFAPMGRFFPGVRAPAPLAYQQLLLEHLLPLLEGHFFDSAPQFKFLMCHYSLVTTPPSQLGMLQRIPHFDSVESNGLASVHYLFKENLGGTAFYRHRKTGFESVDESRREQYFRSLEGENDGPNLPGPEYINGDTALYEQIMNVEAVFNRLIIYRRNSLHSGSLGPDFIPDPNPLTGRISINTFIDIL